MLWYICVRLHADDSRWDSVHLGAFGGMTTALALSLSGETKARLGQLGWSRRALKSGAHTTR